ncbi:MAG: VWA domain-containing protein [Candidatus Acidiferrum sp.]
MNNSFASSKKHVMRRFGRLLALAVALIVTLAVGEFRAQQPAPPQSTPPPAQPAAQQPAPQQGQPQLQRPQEGQPTIAVQVKTVSVLATVRDKHGKIVPDLTKDDFALDEDGRPQTINYFVHQSDLPLRLGLLVDTSLSQSRVIDQERTASYTFLDQLLRENKDLAFVIHFDREVELLQDFTPSHPKLQAALQKLSLPQMEDNGGNNGGGGSGAGGSGGGGGGGYGGGGYGGHGGQGQGRRMHGGTLLYDAIFLASDELMSKQQGRKALIVLTDGVDHGSQETLAEAIASAQRADTIVYSIYFADEDQDYGRPGGFGMGGRGGMGGGRGGRYPPREERPDGKKILEQISKETGGQLFKASKKETVDKIYAEIQEDLRNQYSLAYTPDKGNTIGYHKIQLTVPKQKDLIVQARDGYYYGQ